MLGSRVRAPGGALEKEFRNELLFLLSAHSEHLNLLGGVDILAKICLLLKNGIYLWCLVPVALDSSSYRVCFFITFVPETEDIPLKERVRRVNAHCIATGWSCYTCKGHTQSDTLADSLYQSAQQHLPGTRIRTDYSDNDPDWEENVYILRKSHCAAVLTENFFMDNHSDLDFIQSQAGKQAIIDTHVEGIIVKNLNIA